MNHNLWFTQLLLKEYSKSLWSCEYFIIRLFTLEFIIELSIHRYWQGAGVTFEDGYHSIMNHNMTHIMNTT